MAPERPSDIPKTWVIVLVLAAGIVMAPFVGWIVLAIWLSGFAHGLHDRITRRLHGRVKLAALLTCVVLTLVLVPIGIVLTLLVMDAIALITQLAQSDRAHTLLVSLVEPENGAAPSKSIGELVLSQGDRAIAFAKTILSSAAQIVIGLVILVAGIYSILVDGKRWYAWAVENAPIGSHALRRMAAAFVETGRGLAFGVLGAGLLQALVATAAYLVLDVPQALALGLLTLLFSIVPAIGTAIVWVPVATGLALTGRVGAGIGLAIYGVVVIGTIDNLARPWLARRGKLQLPTFVVLVSMFGAVELFGGWGVVFGPLLVRLAKEALELRHEAMPA
ncbi:MAG TPA: AI-2E family transporter [Kofleriaceae bacterium]|nr:AI-2E family transporter [Kofleriaceae bacterium]